MMRRTLIKKYDIWCLILGIKDVYSKLVDVRGVK